MNQPVTSPAPSRARAAFHAMTEGTQEDWLIIEAANHELDAALPERVLGHLRLLGGDFDGFAVDRLTHSLQTATRAERAGRSDEYILCALLHDIGDTLGPHNHSDVAAAIVKPFVDPDLHWLVEHHGEFQGYYFFHFAGLDRDRRDRYRDDPRFDLTAEFCAEYDQNSFDPDHPTHSLEHYEPLVRDLMARPKRSMYAGTD
ncbi:MAG: HD domain-containing protein [Frankia sp.]